MLFSAEKQIKEVPTVPVISCEERAQIISNHERKTVQDRQEQDWRPGRQGPRDSVAPAPRCAWAPTSKTSSSFNPSHACCPSHHSSASLFTASPNPPVLYIQPPIPQTMATEVSRFCPAASLPRPRRPAHSPTEQPRLDPPSLGGPAGMQS